jgi:nitrate reductase gamma subunit
MERDKKLKLHIRGMLAAALGLWAAFFAELFARTPVLRNSLQVFGDNMVLGIVIVSFMFVGLFILLINRLKKRQFRRVGILE